MPKHDDRWDTIHDESSGPAIVADLDKFAVCTDGSLILGFAHPEGKPMIQVVISLGDLVALVEKLPGLLADYKASVN